jgi:hypothetical protein
MRGERAPMLPLKAVRKPALNLEDDNPHRSPRDMMLLTVTLGWMELPRKRGIVSGTPNRSR